MKRLWLAVPSVPARGRAPTRSSRRRGPSRPINSSTPVTRRARSSRRPASSVPAGIPSASKLEGDAVWSALQARRRQRAARLRRERRDLQRDRRHVEEGRHSSHGAIAVVSLAQTSDGTVWAGAMPGNKIWKIDVDGGKATAGPRAQGRRDDLVARRGGQHRLRGHRPARQAVLDHAAAPRRKCSTPRTSASPR